MPYIGEAERQVMDPALNDLAQRVSKIHTSRPGDMNYAFSALIKKVYGGKLKYWEYNEIIGVLESCKLEFYRDRVGVYEQAKKLANGDLYLDKP